MNISKNKNTILTILATAAITFSLSFLLLKYTGGNTAKQTGGNATCVFEQEECQ